MRVAFYSDFRDDTSVVVESPSIWRLLAYGAGAFVIWQILTGGAERALRVK